MEKIKALLMQDGVSTHFVMEQLGIKKLQATKLLHDLGAFCDHKASKWRLPNVERIKNCQFNFRNNYKNQEVFNE